MLEKENKSKIKKIKPILRTRKSLCWRIQSGEARVPRRNEARKYPKGIPREQ